MRDIEHGLGATDIRVERFVRGGELEARLITRRSLLRTEFIFLIHGYDTYSGDAADAYDRLLSVVEARLPNAVDSIFTVSWPGKRFYPDAVALCGRVGEALAAFLVEHSILRRATTVTFVAHSLGCRVVLEMLEALRRRSLGPFKNVRLLLMGAAVPVAMTRPTGYLYPAISFATLANVYFSQADLALRAFRLGQFLGPKEEGIFPEAVGVNGGPTQGTWDERLHMRGFNHNEYWSNLKMHQEICRLIGRDERSLDTRHL